VSFIKYFLTGFLVAAVFLAGFYSGHFLDLGENAPLLSPFSATELEPELALLQYTITNLAKRRYTPSSITIGKVLEETPLVTSFLFSYQSTNRKITGQLNIPSRLLKPTADQTEPVPVIIMLRGFVPEEIYATGVGTRSAAAVLAQNGYVTLAPDFLGFGESDPEPADVWEARFIKPINVIELINSLKANPTLRPSLLEEQTVLLDTTKLGLWAHSNGGQIALTVLEILGEPLPTTLWAPVTAPFPYSVLFFSDENADEGREARAWVNLFERDYDAREFSLTQHLDRLTGPIQLHHGLTDEAALKTWSDEFATKVEVENKRRETSAEIELPAVDLTYFTYPTADHNLQPSWNSVIARDLTFFNTHLSE
jgi:pimeloyl-ACP methyl ester carboxylesterase